MKTNFQEIYDNLSREEKKALAISIKERLLEIMEISPEYLLNYYSKEDLIASLSEHNIIDINATKKELTDWLEKQVMD